jgi:hypothetical protein
VYRGPFGAAAYQAVYPSEVGALAVAHQVGVPIAAAALLTTPFALVSHWCAAGGIVALAFLVAMAARLATQVIVPPMLRTGRWRFRGSVAVLSLLQPIARLWGRVTGPRAATEEAVRRLPITGPVGRARGRTLLVPIVGERQASTAAVVATLRGAGLAVQGTSGWDDHDGAFPASSILSGRLVTSGCPDGVLQVRVRRGLRIRVLAAVALAAVVVRPGPLGLAVLLAGVAVEVARGLWRTGPAVRRAIERAVDASGTLDGAR